MTAPEEERGLPPSYYENFKRLMARGDWAGAGVEAASLIDLEQKSEFDDGTPLFELATRHADGGPRVEVEIRHLDRVLSVDVDLNTMLRSIETERAFPCLKLLAWSLVEAWRSTTAGARPGRWRPHRIGNGKPPDQMEITDRLRGTPYLAPGRDREIERYVREGEDVLLFGRPASGKSTSAMMVAKKLRTRRRGLVWLDLNDPRDGAESVLVTLLLAPMRTSYLIGVDNLQANISAAGEIYSVVDWLRDELDVTLQTLATGWDSVLRAQLNLPDRLTHVRATGDEVISLLVNGLDDEHGIAILQRSNGDLVLAAAALSFHRRCDRVPNYDEMAFEIAESIGASRLDPDGGARAWLYWFACLGMYEIDINAVQCAEIVPPEIIERLTKAELIYTNDESLSVGHRSLAWLLTRYARTNPDWAGTPLTSPSTIAFEYLQQAEDDLMSAVLDKLDLFDVGDDRPARHLARDWQRLTLLGNLVMSATLEEHPLWEEDTTAAVNAGLTLALHPRRRDPGYQEACGHIAKTVREWWDYDDRGGPALRAGHSEAPFLGIEEAVPDDASILGEVDLARCHRMWALGLLLDFEANLLAPARRPDLFATLAANASALNQGFGAFYSPKMPWITAAVLYGMKANGRFALSTEESADRAKTWLRKQELGEAGHGIATWKAYLPATALCVLALLRAGIPAGSPYIVRTCAYLWEKRDSWSRTGREPDGALVVEALFRAGRHIDDLNKYVYQQLLWVVDEEKWDTAAWPSDPEERLRSRRALTRVAARMVSVVPALVRRRLEQLLEEFDRGPGGDEEDGGGDASGIGLGVGIGVGDGGEAQPPRQNPPDPEVKRVNGETAPAVEEPLSSVPLKELQQAVAWISRHVRDNVISRENTLSSMHTPDGRAKISAKLAAWRGYQDTCEEIATQLTDTTSVAVVRQLNELGRATLAHAWVPFSVED